MKRIALIILCLCPSLAMATTILTLGERELTLRADAVVFGRIITTRTLVSRSHQQIATEADFQIYRVVKAGQICVEGEVIQIQVPGGEANGLTQRVAGSPQLAPGQMFVAFLNGHGQRTFTPWGLSYGLLPVRQNAPGELLVSSQTDGLQPEMSTGEPPADRMLQITNEPLEQVLTRLERHLGYTAPADLPADQGVAR